MIRLGYEIGTGDPVSIPLRHTAVTGQTQESGKTTTLEALIARSGLRAVAFITKRGEKSFRLVNPIAPYFREPALNAETPMWRWVESIFGTLGESVGSDDQALIIQCSRYVLKTEDYTQKAEKRTRVVESRREPVATLKQVAANVALMLQHARGRDRKSLTRLDAYFQIVMPQIARMKSSRDLDLADGINVMDLDGLTSEMQMLIVRSVLEAVYTERRNTVVIIPEAWKFIPRARSSPVRFAAEIYIRQGLALKNVLMLDSQDLANIATEVLKSIGVWILGKQSEINEVKRVVDYIPASPRIAREAIMQLGKGEFYVVAEGKVKKCYVQPAGMEDLQAQAIARGEESANSWGEIERTLDHGAKNANKAAQARLDDPDSGGDLSDGAAGITVDNGESAVGESEDEEMWKERAEQAEAEVMRLREEVARLGRVLNSIAAGPPTEELRQMNRDSLATSNGGGLPLPGGAVDVDVAYEHIRARLLADESMLVVLDSLRPEIRLKIDRPLLHVDGNSTMGRVAQLIRDGFFAAATPPANVLREFKARGWIREKEGYAELIKPMKEITEMGFLRIESGNYIAVPGMKISKADA